MATSTVTRLEAELKTCVEDLERMQADHPDQQFPDEIAGRWDRTNRTVEELKKSLELARREERMEELKRAATGDGNIERIDGQIQIGNAQWRNDPFDVNSIERDFNPAREGQQFKDRARHIIESEFRFRHPNVDQDSAKHSATQMVEDIDPEDGRISRHM